MRRNLLIYILLVIWIMPCCHSNKYSGMHIDSEDVSGYVQTYTVIADSHKEFLRYIDTHNVVDTNEIKDYPTLMYLLGRNGFPDVEYFMYVHGKLHPVVAAIAAHPDEERYPGLGTADSAFMETMEAGEREYRKYLDDSTLDEDKKAFYRNCISQIETTKVDLFNKQEKNKAWLSLIRGEIGGDLNLSDNDIMLLTNLERDIPKL
ncbi:MAG: hypothetical protein II852_04825 [Bacteroidales bacterium]|nr:hypothetical protein [Bacteroidales bacterium]